MTLPDCMMPDGGQVCAAYTEAVAENRRLTRELDEAKRENERLYAVFRSLGVIKYKDLPRALPAAPNEAGK